MVVVFSMVVCGSIEFCVIEIVVDLLCGFILCALCRMVVVCGCVELVLCYMTVYVFGWRLLLHMVVAMMRHIGGWFKIAE